MNVYYWALYAARIKAISHTSPVFHFRCISKVANREYEMYIVYVSVPWLLMYRVLWGGFYQNL